MGASRLPSSAHPHARTPGGRHVRHPARRQGRTRVAAAARGAGSERAHWREPEDMRDPSTTYRGAAMSVLAAFAEPGVLGREFALPELGRVVPGRMALGFHLVDYVVHAWDVAAALGVTPALPAAVLEAALGVALLVPTDPVGRGPGFAFAPPLAVPPGADPLAATLRLLGRDPGMWAAARQPWRVRWNLKCCSERPRSGVRSRQPGP
ncbi:TIGR03086 family metal-binding protein [Streptomyces sp. NPDC093984]|uniref:TIGR03086 family metal-binding protein n=1 Tax=Streptomyces sp. NPDC093984 TaxID=3366052 RepID=UPI0037FD8CAD